MIKIGTGVLTGDDDVVIDEPSFLEIARAVSQLKCLGYEVILVSSGAVGAGLTEFGIKKRPVGIANIQAFAAIGQSKLLSLYRKHLSVWNLNVGQILLTYSDLKSEKRRERVLRTLDAMLAMETVIPIINENDTVAPEHERFDGNDILAANIAALCGARQLLMLTTVDGLLARNDDGSQKLVREVIDVDEAMALVEESKGAISVGGMQSKLEAIQFALSHGVESFIANGKCASQIPALIDGVYTERTRFEPDFEPELLE
ncbi:MAG: glutamate 5-kinase [Akkermansiaceae bacterium]